MENQDRKEKSQCQSLKFHQNLHFIYVFVSWILVAIFAYVNNNFLLFTSAMTPMDNGSKFKVTRPYQSTNSTFLMFSAAFSLDRELIIPILTKLCVDMIGN